MSLAFDENGRPFIILREQEKKKRTKGLEAHKVSDSFSAQNYIPWVDTLNRLPLFGNPISLSQFF